MSFHSLLKLYLNIFRQEGAEVSTMEKLQKAHSNVVVSLTSQYRMNREISMLSSKLFYENRLLCGNEAVSRSSLDRTGDYSVPEGLDGKLMSVFFHYFLSF